MKKLFEFREEYTTGELNETEVKANPMEQFQQWLQAAIDSGVPEANAMTIATCTASGKPSARVVLLKEINKNGFVFFTNYLSRKGRELLENPFAALVFDWHS
ncbi:MAG: pyridoxamine 5'-phosphate oxidase family protein, partial [Petrimonas sp.]|nr:pyridoxamine 5'-phosphate oxidase family protein [Petrimonas sp.]